MRKQVRQGCCGYLLCSHSPQSDVSDLKQVISISEVSLLNNTVDVTPLLSRCDTHPVRGPPREDVPHHGPTVPTPRDSKAEPGPVIAKFNHLNLSPVTLKLEIEGRLSNV